MRRNRIGLQVIELESGPVSVTDSTQVTENDSQVPSSNTHLPLQSPGTFARSVELARC